MSEMTPNSPLDMLAKELAIVKMELIKLNRRLDENDQFSLKILQTLKISEETFDIRVARSHHNLLSHMTHSLEHSIESHADEIKARKRGFTVLVVNGKDVLENDETIQVTKLKEGGYDYSRAAEPLEVNNQGTESFSKYFDEHPEVFGERQTILVNVLAFAPVKQTIGG